MATDAATSPPSQQPGTKDNPVDVNKSAVLARKRDAAARTADCVNAASASSNGSNNPPTRAIAVTNLRRYFDPLRVVSAEVVFNVNAMLQGRSGKHKLVWRERPRKKEF